MIQQFRVGTAPNLIFYPPEGVLDGAATLTITEDNGTLIDPGDDAALAAAMIARARQERAYDPAAIRRTVDERFSPAAVGARFVDVYQRVLGHA